jgi:Protein of unknown function (DUF2512)
MKKMIAKQTSIMAWIAKILGTSLAAWIAFSYLDDNTIGWILLIGVLGTMVNYAIGDLLVLPNFGNALAVVGDGLMAAILVFIIDLLTNGFNTSYSNLLIFAAIVMVFEYFFHRYLKSVHD